MEVINALVLAGQKSGLHSKPFCAALQSEIHGMSLEPVIDVADFLPQCFRVLSVRSRMEECTTEEFWEKIGTCFADLGLPEQDEHSNIGLCCSDRLIAGAQGSGDVALLKAWLPSLRIPEVQHHVSQVGNVVDALNATILSCTPSP
eukprot:6466676-Amphidinium_carterae.3